MLAWLRRLMNPSHPKLVPPGTFAAAPRGMMDIIIVAPAGFGKSRLARAILDQLDPADRGRVTIHTGGPEALTPVGRGSYSLKLRSMERETL